MVLMGVLIRAGWVKVEFINNKWENSEYYMSKTVKSVQSALIHLQCPEHTF